MERFERDGKDVYYMTNELKDILFDENGKANSDCKIMHNIFNQDIIYEANFGTLYAVVFVLTFCDVGKRYILEIFDEMENNELVYHNDYKTREEAITKSNQLVASYVMEREVL